MNTPQTFNRVHTVLVVSSDATSRDEIENLLSLSSRFHSQSVSIEALEDFKPRNDPEIIIADATELSEIQLKIMALLRQKFPKVPIFLISGKLDDGQIRQLLKLNIQDWLKKPLDKSIFHNALFAATEFEKTSKSEVHAIVGSMGGVGATTIATSVAEFVARKKAKDKSSVALFDLDFSTGNCAYSLNVQNSFNLESIISSPKRVDAEFVDIIKHKHEKGFSLYSFKRPEIVIVPTGTELVLRMLDAVSMQHDYTILDIPYYETPWKDEVLAAVNTVTIVSKITLPAIKHAKELARRIQQIRSDDQQIRLVFNRQRKQLFGQNIKFKKIKELFKEHNLLSFTDDVKTLEEAANRGMFPSEINPSSKFVKELDKFVNAQILVGAKKA